MYLSQLGSLEEAEVFAGRAGGEPNALFCPTGNGKNDCAHDREFEI
jgi:hypothetical protein